MADSEARDISNEAFWRKFSESFQVTFELLEEVAEKEGIDLFTLDADEFAEERRLLKEAAEGHKICRAAKAYIDMAEAWFDGAMDFFVDGDKEPEDRSIVQTKREPERNSLVEPRRWSVGTSTRLM